MFKAGIDLQGIFSVSVDEPLAMRLQKIILWRCPVAAGVTLGITELLLFAIYEMNLDFLSTVLFLLICYYGFRFAWGVFGSQLEALLFQDIPDEGPEVPNRLRSFDELKKLVAFVQSKIDFLFNWIHEYIQNPNVHKHLIFFGSMFLLFATFTIIGTFWTFSILLKSILLVPGLYFHPKVRQLVAEQLEKVKKD